MICRCVIFGGNPGYVPVHRNTDLGRLTEYLPCPECGGTGRVHCCEGERPGNCADRPIQDDLDDA